MSEYDIVNESPYFTDWYNNTIEKSPDYELIEDQSLQKLRLSSKKLLKNNYIAVTCQQAYVNSILGGKIKIGITSSKKEQKKQVQKFLQKQTKKVDLSRELSLDQIAEQIINSSFEDGDILISLPQDKYYTGKVKTYVELISARRIKTPPSKKSNDLVKEGVEYYKSGKIKGYWVISNKTDRSDVTYWNASDDDYDFLPAYKKDGEITRKVCWLFKAPLNLRPSQSRQFPVLTGVMGLIRFINQMLEAVLLGIRVAACFSAFIETSNPAGTRTGTTEADQNEQIKVKGKRLTKLQPAMISYLRNGETINFGAPNRPSDNFDPFMMRLLRMVSATIRIPYEQVFLDLGITNYSSWRGGALETERNINRWRRDLEAVLRWIIMTWLQEGVVKKELDDSLDTMRMEIVFPKFKSLDEEKTARADKINRAIESTSDHRIQEMKGEDWDMLQEQLDEEMKTKTEREAEELKLKKELEEQYGIIFPVEGTIHERETPKREGEQEETEEEDKLERRREDGNV